MRGLLGGKMGLNLMKVSVSTGITALIMFLISSLVFMPTRYSGGMMSGFYYPGIYMITYGLLYSFLFGFIVGLVYLFIYNLIDKNQNEHKNDKNKPRR